MPSTGVRVEISTEESAELARHRRWRETGLFVVTLILFTAIFVVSLWFAFLAPSTDAERRQSAMAILVTLIGALGGFLGGRASK